LVAYGIASSSTAGFDSRLYLCHKVLLGEIPEQENSVLVEQHGRQRFSLQFKGNELIKPLEPEATAPRMLRLRRTAKKLTARARSSSTIDARMWKHSQHKNEKGDVCFTSPFLYL
jgi:hypothetical protein